MLPNQAAFLAMIRHSEGTDRAADPYRVVYGFTHTLVDLSNHPAITGEWRGASIADLGPRYANSITTAAGAYQITKPTWIDCQTALRLPDFTPGSQDDAALWLIKRVNAMELVNAGALGAAVARCRNVWASLPGGASGQPQRTLAVLTQAYSTAGGTFA